MYPYTLLVSVDPNQFPDLINTTTVKFLGKGIHHTKAGAKITVVTCTFIYWWTGSVYSDVYLLYWLIAITYKSPNSK